VRPKHLAPSAVQARRDPSGRRHLNTINPDAVNSSLRLQIKTIEGVK
jgi:hypothetical protein